YIYILFSCSYFPEVAITTVTNQSSLALASEMRSVLLSAETISSSEANGSSTTAEPLEEIEGRVLVSVGTGHSQGCRSYLGGIGRCVPYADCAVSFENEFAARSSLCGFSNRRPLLCCPHDKFAYGPASFQIPVFPGFQQNFFQQNPFASSFFYTPAQNFYQQQPSFRYWQTSYRSFNPSFSRGLQQGDFYTNPPYGNDFSFRPGTYRQPSGRPSTQQPHFYHNYPQRPNHHYYHNSNNDQKKQFYYYQSQNPQYAGEGSGVSVGAGGTSSPNDYGSTRHVNNQNPSSFYAGYAGYQPSQFVRPQQPSHHRPTDVGQLPPVSQSRPLPNQFGLPSLKPPYNSPTGSERPILEYALQVNSPYCGLTNTTTKRIVGGREAAVGAWPWLAILFVDVSGNGYKAPLCGGALINPTHILTAAHCVNLMGSVLPANRFTVRLGEHDYLATHDGANPVDIDISRVFSHPRFNNRTYLNDIAIMRMRRSVPYGQGIAPICIPISTGNDTEYEGRSASVAGWGELYYAGPASSILQEVTLPIQALDTCQEAFKRTVIKFNESYLCAGSLQGDRDTCRGDSGGPLMLLNDQGSYTVIGVTSFGRRCAEKGYPGSYTRVSRYQDWIRNILTQP
ncbi:transmembrane protease serine 9-like, partial [Tropilaelaps mercedesae]